MPSRAPRICRCGKVVAYRQKCPCTAAETKARKAKADGKRPNARARGYDRAWEAARAEWLSAYPSCRRCGQPGTLVDHIIPIRTAPHRRLDRTNFQTLCTGCHSGWKQSQERK